MPFRKPRTQAPPRSAVTDWRSFDGVAEEYDRLRAAVHAPPVRDLLEMLGPLEGARILDVGTGTGIAASEAMALVGPEGSVTGVDASAGMLGRARHRGLSRLAVAEAIDLPFPDSSFDVVVSTFVIFFFRKYQTALYDMLRVLRTGGRLGVTTWGSAEDEFRRTWREVAESFVGREMLRDAGRQMAPWEEMFSDPARLRQTLHEAGLREVRVEEREYRVTMRVADYLATRELAGTGRFMRSMLGAATWERFREQVASEFASRFPDPIGDTEDVLLAIGTKPA